MPDTPRTVWVVMYDYGHPHGDDSWQIEKVFESEADARAYAGDEPKREVEEHAVVPAVHTAT